MAWVYKGKIGNGVIEIHEDDFKTFCKKVGLVGDMPSQCGKCGSTNIHLYHKDPQGNDYYGLACTDCQAEFNLHQRKEGGFYIKPTDQWEKYVGKKGDGQQQGGQQDDAVANAEKVFGNQQGDQQDIPF